MRILDKESKNKRIKSFIIILALIFLSLILRLYQLQIIKGDEYATKSARNSLRTNILEPVRGKIYSKDGTLLASNITGYQLIHKESQNISSDEYELLKKMENKSDDEIDNLLINSKSITKKKLKEIHKDILDMQKISNQEYLDIAEKFFKILPEGFDKIIVINEDLETSKALVNVENINNPRIDIVEYNKRYYHFKDLASHVIGYVKLINDKEYSELKNNGYSNNDLIGKDGIEKTYDLVMKGKSGTEYIEVDARGNILNKLYEEKAIPGKNIYLSLDMNLQKYMNDKFKNKTGTFIAIDVKTGKILTYVSYPEIDLNLLSSRISKKDWENLLNSKKTPLLNRGVSGLFPPGSTIKVLTGSSLLEQGVVNLNTIYNSVGEFKYGNVVFRDDHRQGYGPTDFYKSLSSSVNTYFYNYIVKADREKYFELAKNFGVGELTNIDIPGELTGVLPTPEWKKKRFKNIKNQIWLPGDLINMSIGQGYMLTTPIQILMIYQAIANNGIMLKPTFVDSFETQSGNREEKKVEELRKLNISQRTIDALKKGLRQTVTSGTAKILSNLPVEVSAKTGTAQNSKGDDHSWMVSYFPSNNPKIAVVALVENGGYGSVEAGNMVLDFIKKYYEVESGEE